MIDNDYTTTNPHARDIRLDWAAWWIAQGARVFLVVPGTKRPYGNCPRCNFNDPNVPTHDMATCPCVGCHGFHSATDDLGRFAAMLAQHPDGWLAIATGDITVLDVESDDRLNPGMPYGVDVLEQWEMWTGWELTPTLTATSPSGGYHLYYRSDEQVPNGRKPVPNIESKGHGNLVVVPPSPGRRLLPYVTTIAPLQPELLHAIQNATASGGSSNGYAGAAGGGNQLPPTDEFLTRGLGWFTGSRNRDAFRLACRLWMKLADEHEVLDIVKQCWDATPNQHDSSWHEIQRTARSAGNRMARQRVDDEALVETYLRSTR